MLHIKLAEISDSCKIVELLNETTLFLHKKHINQWKYPWNIDNIKKEINKRKVYAVKFNKLIIGTFSIIDKNKESMLPQIMEDGLYLYRVAILPQFQGRSIGIQIMNYLFKYSKKLRKTLYLDCWAGNENLKEFYIKAGFKLCGEFPEEDYKICVFKYN
ncbi:MAG: hypothetical protein K0R54_1169 [Clostridiaceae bacterium]|jgi:ribosomal protein S18 acetylase RimI-like enzyme|nr:hypothetical protein [Clostridiaceae bacterium]